MTPDRTNLRLAIPNKGRMQQPTADLLRDAGLVYEKTDRALAVPVRNVDMELLFVRTEDIPELVTDGVADLGVTGLDLLAEHESKLEVLVELGYGRCKLVAAAPATSAITSIEDFANLRIATAHTNVARRFFAEKGLDVSVIPLNGSVEVAPKLDIADAIVDLVSSGSTMLVNGLRPVVTILESQAVLVAGPSATERFSAATDQVVTMFQAVVAGRRKRYVLMNAPVTAITAIEELIPGLDAPTVVPIAHDGMVAIHSVVDANEIWTLLPLLKAAGATGILVLPVEQLVP